MFEHPDALKLSRTAQFYINESKYDLKRIKQKLLLFESILEVPADDSIGQL